MVKFGIRTPSLKKSFKARTTGRVKRSIKKSINPIYGKKGMGLINNPKKAIYNKVYNKTTISVTKGLTAPVSRTNTSKNTSNSNVTINLNDLTTSPDIILTGMNETIYKSPIDELSDYTFSRMMSYKKVSGIFKTKAYDPIQNKYWIFDKENWKKVIDFQTKYKNYIKEKDTPRTTKDKYLNNLNSNIAKLQKSFTIFGYSTENKISLITKYIPGQVMLYITII